MAAARAAMSLAALAVTVAGLTGCGGGVQRAMQSAEAAASPSPASPSPASPSPAAIETFRSPRTHPAVAPPVRIRIPAARVDSGLQRLGRAPNGTIQVPRDPDVAGWYANGPRPGQLGPAVILGHVDSKRGPAVFFDVANLRPGSRIHIDRSDGSTADFRVTRLVRVPKDRFPSELVYAPSLEASLRLVTCGGTIDPRTGHYRDNVIVFAVAA
jgi:hypothetical protein